MSVRASGSAYRFVHEREGADYFWRLRGTRGELLVNSTMVRSILLPPRPGAPGEYMVYVGTACSGEPTAVSFMGHYASFYADLVSGRLYRTGARNPVLNLDAAYKDMPPGSWIPTGRAVVRSPWLDEFARRFYEALAAVPGWREAT